MIRKLQPTDIDKVMEIWLTSNEDAHPFVDKEYWKSNFDEVKKKMLHAEVFVYEHNSEIQGFVGIIDNYIAGIFIDRNYRSSGIGHQLIKYLKKRYNKLTLNVYQKNSRAVEFYKRENFNIISKQVEPDTGEMEYLMVWNKISFD